MEVVMESIDGNDEDNIVVLELDIYEARNIDSELAMEGCLASYCVIAWVDPADEYWTQDSSSNNPRWNRRINLIFDEPMQSRFLKLEVVRIGFLSEIGTSTGVTVVGRARIRLPTKFYTLKRCKVKLVKFVGSGCKLVGEIAVGMELKMEESSLSPSSGQL